MNFAITPVFISTLAACTHFSSIVKPTNQTLNRPIKIDLECATRAILASDAVKKVSFVFLQNDLSAHSDENKSANNLFIYGYFKLRLENSRAHIYVPTPIYNYNDLIGKLYNESTIGPTSSELNPYIVLIKILENIDNACNRDVEFIDLKNKYTMPKIGNGFQMSH